MRSKPSVSIDKEGKARQIHTTSSFVSGLKFSKIIFIATILFFFSCKEHVDFENFSEYEELYLSNRPTLGKVIYVIDMAEESFENSILASSLQGIINKKEARIYIIGGDAGLSRPWEKLNSMESENFWLSHYKEFYGVDNLKEVNLRDAIAEFRKEIKGYLLVSRGEPWTINAATTLAGLDNLVIAFDENKDLLESNGIGLKESLIGRWRNSSECYLYLFNKYYTKMKSKGLGILSPDEYRLRDFLIQQGILTVYGRPTTEEWDTIEYILRETPWNIPVFGYIAVNGVEELLGVITLSKNGKFLIPSDSTSNLSFHVSVLPSSTENFPYNPKSSTGSCKKDSLNVTVAITDGDNLVIPANWYVWQNFWRSPVRGRLPIGWSFSLALNSIVPAIANYYLSTRTENDELVGMLGIGYVHPSFYPDRDFFFSNSFLIMGDLKLGTFWTLDPLLLNPEAPTWESLSKNTMYGFPSGVLSGYFPLWGPKYFKTTTGIPVLVPISIYGDTPAVLVNRIRDILNKSKSEWPPVVFLSASAWDNPIEELLTSLEPLQKEGVNFLLPSQALKCVP